MKLKDLLTYAIAGAGTVEEMNEITKFYEQWYNIMDSSLEDVKLSRLDLDEMERDYLSIGGTKL